MIETRTTQTENRLDYLVPVVTPTPIRLAFPAIRWRAGADDVAQLRAIQADCEHSSAPLLHSRSNV